MDSFRIAQILRPHGVKGEVKVYPLTDDLARFKRLDDCFIERGGQYEPVRVDGAKFVAESPVLHISGVDTPEAAEKLRGLYLCVDRAHAVKLPEGCWFVKDLIGCRVADTEGRDHGVLTDVLETNANDVYVIEGGGNRLLVPALKKLLNTVDINEKSIVLDADVLAEVGLFED